MCDKNTESYVKLAYQSALEDIRFFKQQQWLLAYYTLLGYGGIIYIVQRLDTKWIIYTILILFSLSTFLILCLLDRSTILARNRKERILDKIIKESGSENEKEIKELFKGKENWLDGWTNARLNSILLLVVIIAGLGLTLIIVDNLFSQGLFCAA